MLIEGQMITIRINNKNQGHFQSLGYDVKFGDIILVPPEHLKRSSPAIVKVKCDIPGCDNVMEKSYSTYLLQHTYDMDVCVQHRKEKAKLTNIEKYGTEWGFQNEKVQKKIEATNIKKYGCKNPSSSEAIRIKVKQTNLQKYGVEFASKLDDTKEKMKRTNLERYGVEYFSQTNTFKTKYQSACMEKYGVKNAFAAEEIKEKIYQTNIDKYGFKSPMQNKDIKAKAMATLSNNGNVPTSTQQLSLYEIIKQKYPKTQLNYQLNSCILDIFVCIDDINIDVEYDGSYWHQDKQRDLKRDKFLQSQGFKTLRIRSGHLLPDEDELFSAIDYLTTTDHCFKEIILSDWKEVDKNESLFDSTAI